MKKVLLSMTFVAATALVACGPSAAEKEKAQHMKDSMRADSVAKADAAKMQAAADSAAAAQAAMAADTTKPAEPAKQLVFASIKERLRTYVAFFILIK